jgi:Ice-binding-like/Secretion system C-terminal sorting domain
MQHKALYFMITFTLLCFPQTNFAQTPNLGAASNFALFTAVGAFNNTGATLVTGDVGTNVGLFNAFPEGTLIGQIHVADLVSAQVAIDVNSAYSYLFGLTCDSVIGTTLGSEQVLGPKIYCLGAASVLNGNLLLDGQGNSNSVFIFKINGAFSSGVSSQVVLMNGASMENVYWQINGAVDLGDSSVFRGTMIANGAISLLESASLFGKALSIAGAINLHHNMVNSSSGIPLPIKLISFKAECVNGYTDITWTTATETNSDFFSIEFSTDAITWMDVKQMNGAGYSTSTLHYTYTDVILHQSISYYRLKQTDSDSSFNYSNTIDVVNCRNITTKLDFTICPNPSKGIIYFSSNTNQEQIISITVYTAFGKQVYNSESQPSNIDLSHFETGIYYAQINTQEHSMTKKIVIEK